jgi:hypothetical protein
MAGINFRRVFILAGLAALVIVYAVLWLRMIASPAERTGADFIAFYAAGRVARQDGMGRVYDPALQQAVQQAQVGFDLVPGQVLLYNHVPYLIPVLWLVSGDAYVVSFVVWTVLLLTLYLLAAGVLVRLLAAPPQRDLLLAAGLLTFFPLFVSLMNGQDTALLCLGACLWLAGLLSGRDWLAGMGLALTTVRPHVSVLLAVPFLFRRRQVFAWFCLAAGVLAAASLLVLGVDGTRAYLNVLLATAGGDWYGMKEPLMVDLIGLLWRVAPGLGAAAIRWTGWAVYGLTLVGLCVLWTRSREIAGKQAGLAVTLALFAVPHLHYHDLALLLVPLTAALLVLVRGGFLRPRDAGLIPLGVSLVLLFSNLVPALKYNFPYLVMLLLILVLWVPGRIFPRPVVKEKTP